MQNKFCIRIAIVFIILISTGNLLRAQSNAAELSRIILEKDSLFWTGYNRCDTALNGQFLADDLEFFHDKGGITVGKAALQLALKKNLCSNANWRLRREAVPGTVKVYPMMNNDTIYGAIILGEHYFYITETGKPEFRDGHASFNHLWLKKNGVWKMQRILSYDHHAAAPPEKKAITVPAATLQQWAGTYNGPNNKGVVIAVAENSLAIRTGKGTLAIYPESANKFFSKERNLSFEFITGANGKASGLRVWENGAVTEELKRVK